MFDLNLRPPYDKKEMITCVKESAQEAYMVKMNEEELEIVSEWILTSKYHRYYWTSPLFDIAN